MMTTGTQGLSKTEIRLAALEAGQANQKERIDKTFAFLQPAKLVGMMVGLVTLMGLVGGWVYTGIGRALDKNAERVSKLAERHVELSTLVTRLQEQRRELADRVRVLEWQIQRAAERVGPLGQAPIRVRKAKPSPAAQPATPPPLVDGGASRR